jgi:hypothetical protein
VISHHGIAAWYETEEKGKMEDVAFITLARSQVTFDNIAMSLKSSEETRWRHLASPAAFSLSRHLTAFSAGLGMKKISAMIKKI